MNILQATLYKAKSGTGPFFSLALSLVLLSRWLSNTFTHKAFSFSSAHVPMQTWALSSMCHKSRTTSVITFFFLTTQLLGHFCTAKNIQTTKELAQKQALPVALKKEKWGSLSGTNIDTITSSKMNGKLQYHGEGNSAFISFYQENNLLSCFVQTATISCHYHPLCCNVLSERGLFGRIKERIVSSP